jgi:hypothetical protein
MSRDRKGTMMLPGLILVGFLEGLLPKPWNVIGAGLTAVFWMLTLVLGESLSIGDRDAVVGGAALALANAFLGMVVGVRLRGIVVQAVRAA